MSKIKGVAPWQPTDAAEGYDCFITTIGYERRARFISEKLRPQSGRYVAAAFTDQQILSFKKNVQWFTDAGFEQHPVPEHAFEAWSEDLLREIVKTGEGDLRIAVDISSMSRLRMASILAALLRLGSDMIIRVDFLYTVAQWSAPSEEAEPILNAGAVLPSFAGWSISPELPTVAVVGLGYEPDKAVGAYEYLEATRVWVFLPDSSDKRYDRDVGRANGSLLDRVPPENRIVYSVTQPFSCYCALEAVVYGAMSTSRPVLLPFGPKIFALCALLVGCVHRDIPVWRISSGAFGHAVDRKSDGSLIGIRTTFAPDRADSMPPG